MKNLSIEVTFIHHIILILIITERFSTTGKSWGHDCVIFHYLATQQAVVYLFVHIYFCIHLNQFLESGKKVFRERLFRPGP